MNQTMTPGRRRALDRKIARAQLNHLLFLTTPEGGETRQQRRQRERSAAKMLQQLEQQERTEDGESQKIREDQIAKVEARHVIAPGKGPDKV